MVHPFRFPIGLLAALAIAFLLGLPHLGSEQLWFDEVLSYSIYRHSPDLGELTRYLATHEHHPPLYYYLMVGWTGLLGYSPFAIRLFSVVANAVAAGLLWGLGRAWFGRTTATVAALLYALSPLAVEFSREARPYALLAALSIGSWWLLSRWLQQERRRFSLLGFVLLSLGGLSTHYAYIFLLASQLVAAAAAVWRTPAGGERARRRYDLLLALLGLTIGYAPWLAVMVNTLAGQFVTVQGITPLSQVVTPVNFLALDLLFNALFLPTKFPLDVLGRTLQVVVVGVALAGAIVFLRRQVSPGNDNRPASSAGRELGWLALWLAVPVALFFLSPIAGRYSWYYHRHLITLVPAIALGLALSLQGLATVLAQVFRRPPVLAAGVAVVFAFNLPQYLTNDSTWDPQHQFADVARYIAARDAGGRELIIGFWPHYRLLLDYYYRGTQTIGSLVPEQLYANRLALVRAAPRLTRMEGYLLTHPQATFRRYQLPEELTRFDVLWVVSVTQSLYDLDVALAAAGWRPTLVELPEHLNLTLYRFERWRDPPPP